MSVQLWVQKVRGAGAGCRKCKEEMAGAGLAHPARCAQIDTPDLRYCDKLTDTGLAILTRCTMELNKDASWIRVNMGMRFILQCVDHHSGISCYVQLL